MRFRRQMVSSCLAIITCLASISMSGQGAQPQADGKQINPLVIGAVLPLSGSQSSYGQEVQAGFEIAIAHWLASHPHLSKKIRLLVADDQSKPSGAREAAEQLAKQRVSLLMGSVSTWTTSAIAAVAKRHQKPHLVPSPCGSASNIMSEGFQFWGCYSWTWQGAILARFLRQELDKKSAALLIDSASKPGQELAEAFATEIQRIGGKVELRLTIDQQDKKATSRQLKQLKSAPVDALVIASANGETIERVFKLAKKHRLRIPILGTEDWNQVDGGAYHGYQGQNYFSFPFHATASTDSARKFTETFKAKLRRFPSPLAAIAYDTMIAAIWAYQDAQTSRPNELIRALGRLQNAPGLLGPMNMGADRSLEKAGVILSRNSKANTFRSVVHAPGT